MDKIDFLSLFEIYHSISYSIVIPNAVHDWKKQLWNLMKYAWRKFLYVVVPKPFNMVSTIVGYVTVEPSNDR